MRPFYVYSGCLSLGDTVLSLKELNLKFELCDILQRSSVDECYITSIQVVLTYKLVTLGLFEVVPCRD